MISQLRLIGRMAITTFVTSYAWLSPAAYITIKFIVPFFQMSFFVFMAKFTQGPEGLAYVAIGNAVQFVAFNTLMGVAITMVGEKWFGTLELVLASPASRLLIFASRALMHVIDGVLSAVIGLVYAGLVFGVSFAQADVPALAVVLIVSSLTTTSMGLIIASLGLFTRNLDPIMNAAYLLVFLLAGISFPIAQLPAVLRVFSYLIPLTYGVEAARQAIGGASLPTLVGPLSIMFGLFFVQGAIGYFLFRRFEWLSKRYGTLHVA